MISKLASLLLHNSARQNCRNARNINSDQAYCYGNAHDIATMDFVTHLSPAFAMAALVEVVGSIPAIPDA